MKRNEETTGAAIVCVHSFSTRWLSRDAIRPRRARHAAPRSARSRGELHAHEAIALT